MQGWDEPPWAVLTPSVPTPFPDCGQEDPSQQELREQLEDAVRVAERFTRRYDSLLREFQEEMFNTSGLLDQLNRQFGWVSRLANYSQGSDGFLQVTTVRPGLGPGNGGRESGTGPQRALCAPSGNLLAPAAAAGMGAKVRGPPGALPRPFPDSRPRGVGLSRFQVLSKAPNPEDPSAPPDTQVTVQLFDSEPLSLTVPGDIPWDDPKFMEIVAKQALQHFKENAV